MCSMSGRTPKAASRSQYVFDDSRFRNHAFLDAVAVFSNNDVKYHANKKRAQLYAASRNDGIPYCPAKDKPFAEALRERPDLLAQKLSWLQRHDRESGDLYGVLQKAKGTPVAKTTHINKSRRGLVIRGRDAYIDARNLAED